MILIGLAWTPFGTYFNFDPGFHFFDYIFHPMENKSRKIKTATFMIRYVATHWSVLEATRSYTLVLIAFMAYYNINSSCLHAINEMPLSEKTIKKYIELQYINKIGQHSLKYISGSLMSAGFLIMVVGNWLSLVGWDFIPIQVNLSMTLITLIVYFVMYESLPMAIYGHEYSKKMIFMWESKYVAKQNLCSFKTKANGMLSVKLWRKMCKAQQPITFYWCSAKYEQATKVNFYSNIIEYTLSIILCFEGAKNNG